MQSVYGIRPWLAVLKADDIVRHSCMQEILMISKMCRYFLFGLLVFLLVATSGCEFLDAFVWDVPMVDPDVTLCVVNSTLYDIILKTDVDLNIATTDRINSGKFTFIYELTSDAAGEEEGTYGRISSLGSIDTAGNGHGTRDISWIKKTSWNVDPGEREIFKVDVKIYWTGIDVGFDVHSYNLQSVTTAIVLDRPLF